MNTPWGKADYKKSITRGLTFVETPTHGGYMASKGFAEKNLDSYALTLAERYGNYYAFEEDVLWAILILDLDSGRQMVPWNVREAILDNYIGYDNWDKLVKRAHKVASRFYPDYFVEGKGSERGINRDAYENGKAFFDQYIKPKLNTEIDQIESMISQFEDFIRRLRQSPHTRAIENAIEKAEHSIERLNANLLRFDVWAGYIDLL